MKKGLKITIIIFCIAIATFIIDSAQALIFDNSPIIKVRKYYDGDTLHYKDGGLFVDTYCGINGTKDTVIKGFSYSLTFDEKIEIIDKTKESNIGCDTALEKFYEDAENTYYYPCIKSEYVIVKYSDGSQETVEEALAKEKIKINDLDKFDIHYIKESKTSSSIVDGYCGNTETTIYFDDSTKYTFMGGNSVTLTDILKNLDYKSEKMCKCLPEYTVDTEFGTGYEINLSEGYARYNGGQADLTKEQIEEITEIIEWSKKQANYGDTFQKPKLDVTDVSSVTIKIFTSINGGPKQKVITDKALISEMVDEWNNVKLKNKVENSKPGTTLSVVFNSEVSFSINNGDLGYGGNYYEKPNNLEEQFKKYYSLAKESETTILFNK